MTVVKKISAILVILVAVWCVSLVWATANKKNIINNISAQFPAGTSIEAVKDYLDEENIKYFIEKREEMIWLAEGNYKYNMHLAFGIDAPSSIIDLMSRRLIISVWFNDDSEVALLEFDEAYTFL